MIVSLLYLHAAHRQQGQGTTFLVCALQSGLFSCMVPPVCCAAACTGSIGRHHLGPEAASYADQGSLSMRTFGISLGLMTETDSMDTASQIERPVLRRDLLSDVVHTELIAVQVAICAGVEASALAGVLLGGGRLPSGCLDH